MNEAVSSARPSKGFFVLSISIIVLLLSVGAGCLYGLYWAATELGVAVALLWLIALVMILAIWRSGGFLKEKTQQEILEWRRRGYLESIESINRLVSQIPYSRRSAGRAKRSSGSENLNRTADDMRLCMLKVLLTSSDSVVRRWIELMDPPDMDELMEAMDPEASDKLWQWADVLLTMRRECGYPHTLLDESETLQCLLVDADS